MIMSKITSIQIDNFLPYMRDVIHCEQSLHELNLMWRIIESSAKMNCPVEAKSILPTMAATREGFNRLEKELVLSLVQEKVATVLNEIGTKAQYVIDILVRNLYERTADVGFLATDKELCTFVAGLSGNEESIRSRLRAYRRKYTVYDEIILLDVDGNVLVQINEETPIEGSLDALIKETLASDQYVETYRASDLRPSKNKALIYSKRMLHPNTGKVIGVLCLCFNFVEEMAGVFKSHGDPSGRSVMLLLDGDNCVIETGDQRWVPVGAVVPVNQNAQSNLKMYGGRGHPIYNAQGKVHAIEGFIQNITERKQIEQSLRDTEFRYRSIFENAIEGIFQTSPNGYYLIVNPALARMYGYSSPEELMLVLNNIQQQLYVIPGRREEFVQAMVTDQSVHNFESLVYRKDNSTLWISENARMVHDEEGNLLYYEGTVEDITARKNYDHKIER